MTTFGATSDIAAMDKILELLREGRSFLLSGHQNPDADVVGSQLAMASLIERLGPGKSVTIANVGSPPRSLSFLDGYKRVKNVDRLEDRFDVAVVFECSGQDRMGNIVDLSSQVSSVINIDHHLHNPNFGHVNFVEPETSSTAELIFKIFKHAGLTPSKAEATCLFSGLVADTGWFRYGNTTPQTLMSGSELLACGVAVAELSERIYMSGTEAAMRLLGWVLADMKLTYDNRVAVLTIPQDVFEKMGATPDDLEEIVNQGLKIASVLVSVLFKERTSHGEVKVSFRSKGTLDINQVACHFGGGGHRNASGCTVKGNLKEVQSRVLSEIEGVFNPKP